MFFKCIIFLFFDIEFYVLRRLKTILGEWTWNPAENLILGVIRLFVRLEDGLIDERLEEIMDSQEGLLTIIINERYNLHHIF